MTDPSTVRQIQIQDGPALPVSISTVKPTGKVMAQLAYGYSILDIVPTQRRGSVRSSALKVYLVPDSELARYEFTGVGKLLDLENIPSMPIYVAPATMPVEPGEAMPVYVLNSGWLDLVQRIADWQTTGNSVHVGGENSAAFTSGAVYTNRTAIARGKAFLQDSTVTQIVLSINAITGAAWKFKVFRWNSGTSLYDMVAEQSFTPTGTGLQTITLNPPIDVLASDIPGLWIPNNDKINISADIPSVVMMRAVFGSDITTSDAFATTSAKILNMDCLGTRPFMAITGHSIPAGTANNGTGVSAWNPIFYPDNNPTQIPGGTVTSEIAHQIRTRIGGGSLLRYQNLCLGSQTWAWALSTGVPACLAVDPAAIMIDMGLNDVRTARPWADVLADMNACRALIPSTIKLYICEMLPATYNSDAQAATLRLWNSYYTTWCLANNATLIVTHDAMGQVRAATGYIDDLKAAYDQDGRHLTTAGVDACAALIAAQLV